MHGDFFCCEVVRVGFVDVVDDEGAEVDVESFEEFLASWGLGGEDDIVVVKHNNYS